MRVVRQDDLKEICFRRIKGAYIHPGKHLLARLRIILVLKAKLCGDPPPTAPKIGDAHGAVHLFKYLLGDHGKFFKRNFISRFMRFFERPRHRHSGSVKNESAEIP